MVWRCEAGRSRTTPLEGLGRVQRSEASSASSVCDDRFRRAPTAQDKPRLLFRRAVHEGFVVEPRTFAATAWMMSTPVLLPAGCAADMLEPRGPIAQANRATTCCRWIRSCACNAELAARVPRAPAPPLPRFADRGSRIAAVLCGALRVTACCRSRRRTTGSTDLAPSPRGPTESTHSTRRNSMKKLPGLALAAAARVSSPPTTTTTTAR